MKPDEIRIGDKPLFVLPNGRMIFEAIEPGTFTIGFGKQGRNYANFAAGALILAEPDMKVIVGPIDFKSSLDIAIAVCQSTPLSITNSRNMHALATALIGLASTLAPAPEPDPVEPALAVANVEVA